MGSFCLDSSNKFLVKYIGNEEVVIIPEGVEVIGEAAFASSFALKTIIFPSTLKKINDLAFFNCINLEIERSNFSGVEIADNAFLSCPKMKKDTFVLKEMTIDQINSQPLRTFYVKDYQRGYRWSKNEIVELLEDIYTAKARYCMQPLMLKTTLMKENKQKLTKNAELEETNNEEKIAYELVDGQQRLTTILLILNKCGATAEYEIYYELLRKIDKHYINEAKNTIDGWLDGKDKQKIIDNIHKSLFFIWYEMRENAGVSIEEEFRNINAGQTPLTNAELFKALLLNPQNAEGTEEQRFKIKEDLMEIAYEWDTIEQSLRNEELWFFICNSECKERTHLDYIFELYALQIKPKKELKDKFELLDKNRDRYSFLAIKAYFEYLVSSKKRTQIEAVKEIWGGIKALYHKLYSWYSDPDLYNKIGYLITTEGKGNGTSIVPSTVNELAGEEKISELKIKAQKKIKEHLSKQIESEKGVFSAEYYNNHSKKEIRDFLLYINIASSIEAKCKFPFNKFKNTRDEKGRLISWDIEHVSAKNLKEDITDEELAKVKNWWEKEDNGRTEYTKEEWRKFAKQVNQDDPDNSVSNLVLLDSATNRSYGNALFFGKRMEIIERDKKSTYIPLVTKNVFLKYYTDSPEHSLAWTQEDKDAYLKEIKRLLGQLNCEDKEGEK